MWFKHDWGHSVHYAQRRVFTFKFIFKIKRKFLHTHTHPRAHAPRVCNTGNPGTNSPGPIMNLQERGEGTLSTILMFKRLLTFMAQDRCSGHNDGIPDSLNGRGT